MGFPPSNAIPITNEAGEPVGYDLPESREMYFHDECGLYHPDGYCPNDSDLDDEVIDPGQPEGWSLPVPEFGPEERDGWQR